MAFASSMLPLGTPAPPFALRDVVGDRIYSLDSFADKTALLVMFICRHCPYVVHVEDEIAKLGQDYIDAELGIVGISSNDPTQYPDDAPSRLKEMAERVCFTFPFCFDETQDVAKAYRAPALRIFISSTGNGAWPTTGNSTIAALGATSRSQAAIFAPRLMRCLQGSRSTVIRRPV
jgi:peroxiredoxin